MNLRLKIITPRKIVVDEEVTSITIPSSEGDMTILPKHAHLLSLLKEGIITMRTGEKEDYLAIGGGYIETNGKDATILVSRAYRQDEIDEDLTQKAIEQAQKTLKEVKEKGARLEAAAVLRRSSIDLKLVKRKRRNSI